MKVRRKILIGLMVAALAVPAVSSAPVFAGENVKTESSEAEQAAEEKMTSSGSEAEQAVEEKMTSSGSEAEQAAEDREGTESVVETVKSGKKAGAAESEKIEFDPSWEYADKSKIHTGTATLYHADPSVANGRVVCINAGHGTKGGSSVKTLCHPDGTPKVTGGTTATGEVEAVAVSSGVDFPDGTTEASHTLSEALITKKTLLDAGYDVLMIRETDDVQLDNIARTLIANHYADCHIAIHYDYTETDKGAFFMSVPSNESYREMEPVKSHWQEHNALGRAVVSGLSSKGFKLCDGGEMEMDLTQTSYSTVPSIDLEVGDKASDTSEKTQTLVAEGIKLGLDRFFVEWEEQKKNS